MVKEIQCIRCGLCKRECDRQMRIISMTDTGVRIELDTCIRCGHCVAVCPTDSMDNPLSARQEFAKPPLAPEETEMLLRSARSVRYFKDELISRDKMTRLLDIGRYPQTITNTQGISYIVIEGRPKIKKLNALFSSVAKRVDEGIPSLKRIKNIVLRQERTNVDIIFRDAPELILALADEENPARNRANAQFSLTFISLLAPSLGIGTCWAGMFEEIATRDEYAAPFLAFAGVPKGKRIYGAMMAGMPNVKFRRLVERDPLQVEWR